VWRRTPVMELAMPNLRQSRGHTAIQESPVVAQHTAKRPPCAGHHSDLTTMHTKLRLRTVSCCITLLPLPYSSKRATGKPRLHYYTQPFRRNVYHMPNTHGLQASQSSSSQAGLATRARVLLAAPRHNVGPPHHGAPHLKAHTNGERRHTCSVVHKNTPSPPT
jgi:hypothetical protein